jgi:cellulose synthase/poly-beta-1,6-N-acetylglucosamine synthase-like glycosyltransferase
MSHALAPMLRCAAVPADPPRASVVIATRNRAERLGRALDALAGQDLEAAFELIVVDDASTDETPSLLADRAAGANGLRLRVERRETRGGPGAARNTGWRLARAPLIAFTDDDCEPRPGWLSALVQSADENGEAFIQGPTRPNPNELHRLGPFARTLEVGALGPWFPTSNMAYPRVVLERLGGFDETLPRGEDTDLAWRAQDLGVTPRWAADAAVWHAVMELGPIGKLRLAAAWSPAVKVLANHPQLRAELVGGIFWKRSHALLLLAALGLAVGRRRKPCLVLTLPYLRYLGATVGAQSAGKRWIPYQVLHDLTELLALARGSISARTLVL